MSKDSILSFRFGRQDLVVPADNFYIPYATYIAGEYDFLDINDDDIVIDAGANIGDFTLKAARDAELVIAIEPNPDTLELLKFNTKNHKNVVIVEKALGSRPGKGIVSGNGVTASIQPADGGELIIETLDHIISDLQVRPTLMKMDIEGAEKFVLPNLACLESLRKIVIETHSELDWSTCVSALERAGFVCREVTRLQVVSRTLRNILRMPISFFLYELSTKFYATKIAVSYLFSRSTSIPSCDNAGLKLLEAHKIPY